MVPCTKLTVLPTKIRLKNKTLCVVDSVSFRTFINIVPNVKPRKTACKLIKWKDLNVILCWFINLKFRFKFYENLNSLTSCTLKMKLFKKMPRRFTSLHNKKQANWTFYKKMFSYLSIKYLVRKKEKLLK